LKALSPTEFDVALWLLKRRLVGGCAQYEALFVKSGEKLKRKLKDIVFNCIDQANVVEPYEFSTADQDDDLVLGLDVKETDFTKMAPRCLVWAG
jgi:hypothetical protein